MFLKVLVQMIGALAMVFSIFSFQAKESKRVLVFQVIASSLWTAHFIMLGAFTGAVFNIVAVIRNGIFYFKKQKWASSILWLYGFIAIYVVICVVTWEGAISLLPLVGMVASTISFYMTNVNKLRVIYLGSSPLWLIYDGLNHSIPGVLTETFSLVSILIALIRSFRLAKKAKLEQSHEIGLEDKTKE